MLLALGYTFRLLLFRERCMMLICIVHIIILLLISFFIVYIIHAITITPAVVFLMIPLYLSTTITAMWEILILLSIQISIQLLLFSFCHILLLTWPLGMFHIVSLALAAVTYFLKALPTSQPLASPFLPLLVMKTRWALSITLLPFVCLITIVIGTSMSATMGTVGLRANPVRCSIRGRSEI